MISEHAACCRVRAGSKDQINERVVDHPVVDHCSSSGNAENLYSRVDCTPDTTPIHLPYRKEIEQIHHVAKIGKGVAELRVSDRAGNCEGGGTGGAKRPM